MDRLSQHGPGQRHTGQIYRVHGIFSRAVPGGRHASPGRSNLGARYYDQLLDLSRLGKVVRLTRCGLLWRLNRLLAFMMVVAAGNQGSNCSTLSSPPSFYEASYTVGALTTGTDTVASFSNRGPVTVDGSHRLKPDITAPGTDIRSSLNASDTAYGTMSGTSMATPHIAGAVALLWSARPEWRHNIAISRTAINNAAVHILNGACDGGHAVTPNNTYGHGRSISLPRLLGPGSPLCHMILITMRIQISFFSMRARARRQFGI